MMCFVEAYYFVYLWVGNLLIMLLFFKQADVLIVNQMPF